MLHIFLISTFYSKNTEKIDQVIMHQEWCEWWKCSFAITGNKTCTEL